MVVTDEPRTTSFHSNKYARQVLGAKNPARPGAGLWRVELGKGGPGADRPVAGPRRPVAALERGEPFCFRQAGRVEAVAGRIRLVAALERVEPPPWGQGNRVEAVAGRSGPFPGIRLARRSAPDQPGPAGRGRRNLRGCSRSERAAGVLSPHASCGCLTRLSEPAVRGHLAARTGGRHPAPGGPPKGAAREVTFPRWIFWRPGTWE